jgi:hypothetical protein
VSKSTGVPFGFVRVRPPPASRFRGVSAEAPSGAKADSLKTRQIVRAHREYQIDLSKSVSGFQLPAFSKNLLATGDWPLVTGL